MCFELCQFCEQEIELPDELGIYICPSCGKWIVNCCQCLEYNCEVCYFADKASFINKDDCYDN